MRYGRFGYAMANLGDISGDGFDGKIDSIIQRMFWRKGCGGGCCKVSFFLFLGGLRNTHNSQLNCNTFQMLPLVLHCQKQEAVNQELSLSTTVLLPGC